MTYRTNLSSHPRCQVKPLPDPSLPTGSSPTTSTTSLFLTTSQISFWFSSRSLFGSDEPGEEASAEERELLPLSLRRGFPPEAAVRFFRDRLRLCEERVEEAREDAEVAAGLLAGASAAKRRLSSSSQAPTPTSTPSSVTLTKTSSTLLTSHSESELPFSLILWSRQKSKALTHRAKLRRGQTRKAVTTGISHHYIGLT